MKRTKTNSNGTHWTVKRYFLGLLLLPLFMIGSGCNPSAKVASGSDLTGTYALVNVDGNKLPYTTQHAGTTMTIKSGAFVINSNATCSSKINLEVSGRATSVEVKATYEREGSTLTMRWQGAGTTTGTVQGDTFTMNNEGMVFAYRK